MKYYLINVSEIISEVFAGFRIVPGKRRQILTSPLAYLQ